jgi:predicted nucleic acid-binding protein
MRFWDASAIVALIIEQPHTPLARELVEENADMVVWWATPVECVSAIARHRRDGGLAPADEAAALHDLDALRAAWHEVLPTESVRAQALRVLRLHPLRSADALQLSAALDWAGMPVSDTIVTFDRRLAASAELEGFRIAGLDG